MSWLGILVGVAVVGFILVVVFFDFEKYRPPAHAPTDNTEQMKALGRVVDHARRLQGEVTDE